MLAVGATARRSRQRPGLLALKTIPEPHPSPQDQSDSRADRACGVA